MMNWDNGGWNAGDWVAMSAMMILLWGVIVAVVLWVVRTARRDRGSAASADEAGALLAERFARGEIDGEEFSRSRELLYGSSSTRFRTGS
jgi:putative membrane protein